MKNSQSSIGEHLIDDLVSGQLTGERYRAALLALEAEPANWRDCALAFLEEQALRSELHALAQGTINWSTESSLESVASVVAKPWQLDNKITLLSTSSHPSASGFTRILSTAALLLVSFTVGWLGSEVIAERQRTALIDSGTSSAVQVPTTTSPTLSPKLEPQFVVDRPGAFDSGIPRSIRELERNGRISVKSYEMMVPTTLEDGSSAFVPVQQLILSRGTVESY